MNLGSAKAMLTSFADRRTLRFANGLVFFYCLLAALPLLVWEFSVLQPHEDRLNAAFVSAVVIGLGTALLWLIYPHHGLNLMRNARSLRMPSVARPVFSGLLKLYFATVVFPAVILGSWDSTHSLDYLATFSCAAFGGFLVASSSRMVVLFFWLCLCLAGLFDAAHYLPVTRFHFAMPKLEGRALAGALWIGALTLGGLVASCWRDQLAQERGESSFFQRMGLRTGGADAQTRRKDPGPGVNFAVADPQHPVAAMRMCLGRPFAALRRRSQPSVGIGIFILIYFGAQYLLPDPSAGMNGYSAGTLLVGLASIGLYKGGSRLRHVFTTRKDDLAELALLPGWGDSRSMCRTLVAVILRHLIVRWAWLAAALGLMGYLAGPSVLVCLVLASAFLGLLASSGGSSLDALVRPADHRGLEPSIFILIALIVATCFVVAPPARSDLSVTVSMIVIAGWLVFAIARGMLGLRSWRRLLARPHPFLSA
ncbi:MAG TPA: hypothetical protein VK753_01020 [Xanthomonadaceae bacterium]|jgi:hypothetical protein|nr:hypothetical protein [Xanthomonadaceae bacterium]